MELVVLPDHGMTPVVHAIRTATREVRVTIFRCDLKEIEKALAEAVTRGVKVHALIAHTAREGEKLLRRLELRLLEAGVTVSRTSDDLLRYHDKILLIDDRLFVLAFNFTRLDGRSRSMGIVTDRSELVAEAARLFEADSLRQPYDSQSDALVVSPVNARMQLTELLRGAERSLRIYDPKILDRHMIRLLKERAAQGVDVRVIGRISKLGADLSVRALPIRLHLRAILQDESRLFVGSQSLRLAELDRRREVGLVTDAAAAIERFQQIFEADWSSAERSAEAILEACDEPPEEPATPLRVVAGTTG
jgi:phosphatidylserine/phosphatidylglycerophosphate/cardiolipin synthase-like enzyme